MRYVVFLALLISAGCSSQKKQADSTPTKASVSSISTAAAPAMKKADSSWPKIVCSKKNDSRILEVVKNKKGCDLDYNKLGKMTVVSKSTFGTKHCVDSQTKIQKKLEKSGFQCQ